MGGLGAALVSMVASLTHGKKGMEASHSRMEELGESGQSMKDRLAYLVDEDTRSFNAVMTAVRMKKKSDEEKELRAQAMDAAAKRATEVPLEVARLCLEVLELAQAVTEEGNQSSVSDAGVASEAALAGLKGARLNVLINLPGIDDEEFCEKSTSEIEDLNERGKSLARETAAAVELTIKEL